VHGIAKAKQIFREIGAILPGDAGDQRHAPFRILGNHIRSNNASGKPEGTPGHRQTWTFALDRPATLGPFDAAPDGQTPHGILNTSKLRLGTPTLAGYGALDHNQAMRGGRSGDFSHSGARPLKKSQSREE
jgi:hypothetical protein